jgi:hypothetical protein
VHSERGDESSPLARHQMARLENRIALRKSDTGFAPPFARQSFQALQRRTENEQAEAALGGMPYADDPTLAGSIRGETAAIGQASSRKADLVLADEVRGRRADEGSTAMENNRSGVRSSTDAL